MEWQAGQFTVKVADQATNAPVERSIAGWVSGLWALDFRVFNVGDAWEDNYRSGWCATHLGTGYHAFSFLMPLDEAKAAVEYVDGLWDWNFTDPDEVKNIIGVMPKVLDAYGDDVTRKASSFAPTIERRAA